MKFTDQEWVALVEWSDVALELTGQDLDDWLDRLPSSCPVPVSILRKLIAEDEVHETVTFLNHLGTRLRNAGSGDQLTSSAPAYPGLHCGGYRLIEQIGRGGMAEVWHADRTDGLLKRPVAVKLPLGGVQGSEFAVRAHRERDILAGLSHPGIARVYDAGVENGRPYLVLELIKGTALDWYCDDRELSIRKRLDLFLQILAAVQYAHANLVIHGDLKPSNILVTEDGEVKLLDFGVANLVSSAGANEKPDETDEPQVGVIAVTPAYAAPEQIAGRRITTACDIYALGVILFEILSGERPPSAKKRVEQKFDGSSPAPSGSVGDERKARLRLSSTARLRAALRGDLDSIVAKAMNFDPAGRYATAEAFRADIDRYLAGKPVVARPESHSYRTRKFIGRNRYAVAAGVVVSLALIAGVIAVLWQARMARAEARTSAEVQKFIQAIFERNSRVQGDPLMARQTTARELLDSAAGNIDRQLKDAPAAKEKMLEILADLYIGLGLEDKAVALNRARVALVTERYGASDPRVAAALCKLAGAMEASTVANEREAVLREASKILDRNRDFASSTRADVLAGFAKVYKDANQSKALTYANRAVALYRRMPPTLGLAKALYDQAVLYGVDTDYEKAEASAAEAVAAARKAPGETTNTIAEFEELLADMDAHLLRYGIAKEHYEAALIAAKELNGPEHEDTIEMEIGLADFYSATSEYPKSLRLMEEAWENCLKVRGPRDPYHTSQVALFYAGALERSGRFEAALAMISRAVENRRRSSPRSSEMGTTLWWQASILANLGEYEKAKLYLDEAAELSIKTGFKLQREYGLTRVAIALHEKRWDDAASAIDTFCGLLPDGGPLSFALLNNLAVRARLALSKNDPDTALRLALRLSDSVTRDSNRKYLRLWEKEAGLSHGLALLEMHDALRALEPLRRAVKLDGEMYGPESAERIPAAAALGIAYWETGSRAEAAQLLAEVEGVRKHHPHLADRFEVPVRELQRDLR